ncbi:MULTISPECIES: hypothetical protein [Streptomyces]|uniref:Cysteine rich repeat protein n=1 Tax=Streptomyces spororaveus TaxID=284039 RepID=A0ABQ3TJ77_9ACTN|nr:MULTISPECIES: hypothetical protein [Streptomyces]MCM9079213.1 hypothetical protein [Streptomyces spororaveus]MCX5306365.1 hypothetical protein [Streptomyces sp. NBC_00160]GHI80458.1 hypothetical protein Sspor_60190 [Streptomyces spororaveus]
MHKSPRIAGVLAGLFLSLAGAAVAAPAAHADIPACTNMAAQSGAEVTDAVAASCRRGVVGDLQGCVSGLTEAGVPGGAANGACRTAALEPR